MATSSQARPFLVGFTNIVAFVKYSACCASTTCLFVCKFGLGFTFMINYLSIVQLFPTLFCGTASGICNFAGRMATIGSPLIAELQPPTPMYILAVLLLMALANSTMLSIPDNNEKDKVKKA